jgi:type II secretory pathway component PulF
MPSFRYQSLTTTGRVSGGMVNAPDRAAAVRQLLGRGETPTIVEQADNAEEGARHGESKNGHRSPGLNGSAAPARAGSFSAFLQSKTERPNLGRADLASLMRELATAIEAGLPLMQALKTVRRQATGKSLPVILDFLIERVEAGTPLHQAAKEYGLPFDDMVVGMMRAADASGRVHEVLHQLSDLLERSVELRREVVGATVYPAIVFVLILASIVILVTVLVPRLMAPIQAQAGFTMPWPTQFLLTAADFIKANWIWIVGAIVVAIVSWRLWVKVPENRLKFDKVKLRTPLLGRLLRDVAVARFTRTLGTLVSAGLPILSALKIVRDTLGNTALMQAIDEVQEKVTTGQSLAEPMERSGYFPPLLIQIVNIGERSGRLESMLMHAAGAFDRQVSNSIKIFTKSLPPVLIIVAAAVASFVLVAILLPMLELQSAIGG